MRVFFRLARSLRPSDEPFWQEKSNRKNGLILISTHSPVRETKDLPLHLLLIPSMQHRVPLPLAFLAVHVFNGVVQSAEDGSHDHDLLPMQ